MTRITVARPCAFLDRDGTIIEERHYLGDLDQVVIEAGAVDALKRLAELGYLLVVVTNQSGIGRGLLTREQVNAVNRRTEVLLREAGVNIDGWYLCPHAPAETCNCRKPLPGMIDQAMQDFDIDLSRSLVIGDKDADLGLAQARGMTGHLVLTGHGREHAEWARNHGFSVHDTLGDITLSLINVKPLQGASH